MLRGPGPSAVAQQTYAYGPGLYGYQLYYKINIIIWWRAKLSHDNFLQKK